MSAGLDPLWAERLLDSFLADLDETAAIGFLTTLEETLRQVLAAERSVSAWHEVLSALRSAVQPLLEPKRLARAENLWQQARVLIGDFAERAQGRRQLAAASQVQTLNDITQSLITTFDVNGLLDVLARDLPQLGIPACYLALYEDPGTPAGGARLLLAYDEAGRLSIEPGGRRVPTRCLVPPSAELGSTFNGILSESPLTSRDGEPLAKNPSLHSGQVLLTATRPFAELALEHTSRDQLAQGDTAGALGTSSGFLPARREWVALPLYFQGEQLGLVVFEMGPHDGSVFEALRVQISSALKGALLATRNVELYREAVAARQVAEKADQLKSRFLSTVSHELRTPLSLIVGTIEMLLREQPDRPSDLPAPYQRDLRSIHSSARHLARLISDVLDLASSQAGELHLVREPLHLDEVLAQAALLGDALAREKGLSWQSDIPAGLPLVWGDRTRLQQVVLNLVSNAVKFTERGNVRLWAERGRRQVVIAVSDSGLGIPAAEQEFIFDEFRQSERAARRGYGGMGLGLAISRRLVELHGGQIGVLSTGAEGAGSTFYFTLPIMQADAAAAGGGEDRSGTVLLLTEHAERGARLAGHLADQGYTVEVMPLTGHPNWLGQIIAAPPGAIVLDFAPGAERGWELMQLLQRAPTTHNIPVIFYTLAEAEDRGAALALDVLAKPAAAADLLAALARQGIDTEQAHGRAILIVDDDPGILDLHARLLEELAPRCRILKARNGQEALALMAQQRPDLVLLDLMMPVLDGFGVLETMHARETLRDIPVIVLTAQVLTGQEMARLQQGVAAVLHKGLFTGPEVLAQVTEALDRNKRLGSAAQRVVRQAMAYIHQHYAEPITREALAQAVGFSDRYLTQCFRAETGLTPVAYLSRYRIKQARGLLESGEGSITEIALATGFADPSYFARVFREVVGVTPRAYQHGGRGG